MHTNVLLLLFYDRRTRRRAYKIEKRFPIEFIRACWVCNSLNSYMRVSIKDEFIIVIMVNADRKVSASKCFYLTPSLLPIACMEFKFLSLHCMAVYRRFSNPIHLILLTAALVLVRPTTLPDLFCGSSSVI